MATKFSTGMGFEQVCLHALLGCSMLRGISFPEAGVNPLPSIIQNWRGSSRVRVKCLKNHLFDVLLLKEGCTAP